MVGGGPPVGEGEVEGRAFWEGEEETSALASFEKVRTESRISRREAIQTLAMERRGPARRRKVEVEAEREKEIGKG